MFVARIYAAELDPLFRQINLFGTMIHESGHSLFALQTGGYLDEFVVRPDSSGYAAIGGGWFFLSLPAGYLSTTLLTALFFGLNNRTRWGDILPFLFGGIYIYLTLKYASGVTTIVVGLLSGIFLCLVGIHPRWRVPFTRIVVDLPDFTWMFFVNVLSLYYALGGLLSLEYLSRNAAHGNIDDVSRFTDMFFPYMDPRSMALIWEFISIVVWLGIVIAIGRLFHRKLKGK